MSKKVILEQRDVGVLIGVLESALRRAQSPRATLALKRLKALYVAMSGDWEAIELVMEEQALRPRKTQKAEGTSAISRSR